MSFKKVLVSRLLGIYARVFARPRFASWNRLCLEASLRGLGILNWEEAALSGEDWFLSFYLPQSLNPNCSPVLVDVGANIGEYSCKFLRHVPNGAVFAIEPNPSSFRVLSSATEKINVSAHELALGEKCGVSALFDYKDTRFGSQHASLFENVLTDLHQADAQSVDVNVTTLDDFCLTHAISRIDLLKIDAEGSELEILKGAKTLLKDGKVDIIQFELNSTQIYSRALFCDFENLLQGYCLFRLLPRALLPLHAASLMERHVFAFQNIVAIRLAK